MAIASRLWKYLRGILDKRVNYTTKTIFVPVVLKLVPSSTEDKEDEDILFGSMINSKKYLLKNLVIL